VTSTTKGKASRAPDGPRFRFFAGKGGVGKTTLAAAAALHASRAGVRVLLVSTDPAHALGDVLQRPVGSRVRAVLGLCALELDAGRALRDWLKPRRRLLRLIAERGTYLTEEDLDALLGRALPGLGELMALRALFALADRSGYAQVFVDTAPTGHTLRLLEMPETLLQLARVLDDMQAKHRALVRALARGYREDAADALIEELAKDAEGTAARLRDPRHVAFTWVLDAEELALAEARDGVGTLRARGMRVDQVAVNRVTPPPPARCALCDGRRRSQAGVLARAARQLSPESLHVVPAHEDEPRGAAALRALGRALATAARAPRAPGRERAGPRPPRRAAPEWPLALAPAARRLLLFAGKGGVGKTSAAAATALELAARGRRVLLLSTDPAHSLGDALDLPLGDAARRVPGVDGLRAREIDALASYAARRERYRALVDELFSGLHARGGVDASYDRAVTQDLLDTAPPGIDELFALDALTSAVDEETPEAERADLVVVDTAPTGHALRLLALPDTVLGWLHTFLGVLRRDRLAGRMPTLTEELLALSRQVRRLLALMRDRQRTAVAVVARAAAVPALETARLRSALRALGIPVAALVANGLTPPGTGCARCRAAARREAAALAGLLRPPHRPPLALAAPLVTPPPRGAAALRAWAAQWRILGA
jgi:arsenite-transporting ATPase